MAGAKVREGLEGSGPVRGSCADGPRGASDGERKSKCPEIGGGREREIAKASVPAPPGNACDGMGIEPSRGERRGGGCGGEGALRVVCGGDEEFHIIKLGTKNKKAATSGGGLQGLHY